MDGRIVYLTTSLYLYSIPTLPITSIGTPSIPIYPYTREYTLLPRNVYPSTSGES